MIVLPDARFAGFTSHELARLERLGEVVRLRRGTYALADDQPADPAARHRRLVKVTMPLLADGSVVSHVSAAVLHGLPVWEEHLRQVQVTRRPPGSGKRRGGVHVRVAPMTAEDVVLVDEMPVTSLARTVVDLGRTLPLTHSVAAGDAALRSGLGQSELDAALVAARGWRGLPAAQRAADLLDGRSESAGESASRVVLHRLGLDPSDLQFEVVDDHGEFVGRVDFVWEGQRTLGEFDGRGKYDRLLSPGTTSADAVHFEKRREDALRDQDWELVRWGSTDLLQETLFAARMRRALRRGAARTLLRPVGPGTPRRPGA
ncbi:hypothetical protein [uncultured Friedmanniella sp.]|uniref:type IV toxin-antitoxin system AbiEi family antitoxin domain-containing protein n=1 Tax=uncultured Friedmanniella sp. TaxID=335381 RepID=UPI0035CBD4D8